MRLLAAVAVSAALLTACAGLPEVAGDVPGPDDPPPAEAEATDDGDAGGPPEPDTAPPAEDEVAAGSPSATDEAEGREAPTAEGDAPAVPAVTVDDHGPVGSMGTALLRAEVPTLTIEVLAQDGADPDGRALNHLEGVVAREVDKPGGVRRLQHIFRSDRRRWSASDVRALAADRRQHRSTPDHAATVVMYLRGEFEDDRVIGVALNATEIAVFPETWRDIVGGVLGAGRDVERSVLVHEMGHLFGLVELTYDSVHDRHDDDRPGHSRNRDSVMYWAIARTAVTHVFDGPPPDDFDGADRDDLRFLRTGSR